MRAYTLTHLGDHELLRDLVTLLAQDHDTTAAVLAHLAEVDVRRLYLPAAYPSMLAYCVHELHLFEDAAYKRIQAARAARRFPAIFPAVADGRLHLAAVCLLAPHLTVENADGLIAAAAHHSKSEIAQLLSQRFPQPEMLALVESLPSSRPETEDGMRRAASPPSNTRHAGACTGRLAPGQVEAAMTCSQVKPHGPGRFAFHFTVGQATYDKFQRIQALLSHAIPSGDVAAVFDRSLDHALAAELGKRKLAATERPRLPRRRALRNPRSIPAEVRRAVWERDREQCAFVSETGRRCSERRFLELDHIDPVARGGQAAVDGMRLRCRAHNQYEAERVFGAGFMKEKRELARAAAEARRRNAHAEERARVEAQARAGTAEAEAHVRAAEAERAQAAVREQARDVLAGLRELGVRADQARRAVEYCATLPVVTLEERMRAALRFLAPKPRFQAPSAATVAVPT